MFSFFHFFRPFHIYTAVHPHFPHVCAEKKKKRKNEKNYFLFYCSTVIAGRIQLGNNHHVNTYDNMLFFVFSFFRFIYIIAKKRKIGKHRNQVRRKKRKKRILEFSICLSWEFYIENIGQNYWDDQISIFSIIYI